MVQGAGLCALSSSRRSDKHRKQQTRKNEVKLGLSSRPTISASRSQNKFSSRRVISTLLIRIDRVRAPECIGESDGFLRRLLGNVAGLP